MNLTMIPTMNKLTKKTNIRWLSATGKWLRLPSILILIICSPWAGAQTFGCTPNASQNQAGALSIAADLLIVRPAMLGATLAGGALFSLALPFTAPTETTDITANALVKTPARATFKRCLGCFEKKWFQAAPPRCTNPNSGGWSSVNNTVYLEQDHQAVWEWSTKSQEWTYIKSEGVPPVLGDNDGTFESGSIQLILQSAPNLNQKNGSAHTLVFKVIQLRDPSILNGYRQSSFRLSDLMAMDVITADSSFLVENRVIVNPGDLKILSIDRLKEARYISVLAGYYQMQDLKSIRVISIPAVHQRVQPEDNSRWWWPFGKNEVQTINEPSRVKIWIELGEDRITSFKARAY